MNGFRKRTRAKFTGIRIHPSGKVQLECKIVLRKLNPAAALIERRVSFSTLNTMFSTQLEMPNKSKNVKRCHKGYRIIC